MLDIGLVEGVLLDLAADRRIIDFLLDLGVDLQFGADLPDQFLLRGGAARRLETLEQILDLAVIGGEKLKAVHDVVVAGHLCLPGCRAETIGASGRFPAFRQTLSPVHVGAYKGA